jgi:predicted unusual protein kinase regulating ubiquinone biosynthesis (AarF/ABC1/UbiB family)
MQAFAYINWTPLASGTVAQVHRARLHDGRDVAVKVQHKAARAMMSGDLMQLKLLTGLLQHLHIDLGFDIRSIVLEYCARVRAVAFATLHALPFSHKKMDKFEFLVLDLLSRL